MHLSTFCWQMVAMEFYPEGTKASWGLGGREGRGREHKPLLSPYLGFIWAPSPSPPSPPGPIKARRRVFCVSLRSRPCSPWSSRRLSPSSVEQNSTSETASDRALGDFGDAVVIQCQSVYIYIYMSYMHIHNMCTYYIIPTM